MASEENDWFGMTLYTSFFIQNCTLPHSFKYPSREFCRVFCTYRTTYDELTSQLFTIKNVSLTFIYVQRIRFLAVLKICSLARTSARHFCVFCLLRKRPLFWCCIDEVVISIVLFNHSRLSSIWSLRAEVIEIY